MFFSTRIKLVVLLWVVAEMLAFVATVHLIGLGGALLAGLATTLIGASMLKRTSAAAMLRLRAVVSGRDQGAPGELLEGSVRALAAAALLLPGFLTDAVGLALAVAPLRAALVRRLGGDSLRHGHGPQPRRGPGTIDLASEEWTVKDAPLSSGEVVSRPRSDRRPVSL